MIIFIIVFSCLFNVPYLFTLSTSGLQCIMDLTNFENRFYFWLSCVVQFIIPFVMLLSMNSVIIHILRNRSLAKKFIATDQGEGQCNSRHPGQGQSESQGQNLETKSSERQIFAILLLVAFSFFVLITPLYAFNIYVQVFDFSKSPKHFAGFYIFYQTVHKLYFTNNAINFFLYVISGQKFRNDLINLFKGRNRNLRKCHRCGIYQNEHHSNVNFKKILILTLIIRSITYYNSRISISHRQPLQKAERIF